ncbi:hypothetical protein D3C87_1993630 [compost metagenome]
MSLGHAGLYRERIEGRHSPLDAWKFQNWETFRASLGTRTIAWPLPADNILQIDNSDPDVRTAAEAVERFIYGSR